MMVVFENRSVQCKENVLVGQFKSSTLPLPGIAPLSLVPKMAVSAREMDGSLDGWDRRKKEEDPSLNDVRKTLN